MNASAPASPDSASSVVDSASSIVDSADASTDSASIVRSRDEIDDVPPSQLAADSVSALDFAMQLSWLCISSIEERQKHVLFDKFFVDPEDVYEPAVAGGLVITPGLWELVQESQPPTIDFFKSLPEATGRIWGVYAIVMEKDGAQAQLYVGSATNMSASVTTRFQQYASGAHLPSNVLKALNEGYGITHKGVLASMPIPHITNMNERRLLMLLVEASFTFLFWAMKSRTNDLALMERFCGWNIAELPFGGLCSHSSMNDRNIRGHFNMTAEELQDLAANHHKRERLIRNHHNRLWHQNKINGPDREEFLRRASARSRKSRALNPQLHRDTQAKRAQWHVEHDTWHCKTCNKSYTTSNWYKQHMESEKHKRTLGIMTAKYKCLTCTKTFHNNGNLTRHLKTEEHARNLLKPVAPESSDAAAADDVDAVDLDDADDVEAESLFGDASDDETEPLVDAAAAPEDESQSVDVVDSQDENLQSLINVDSQDNGHATSDASESEIKHSGPAQPPSSVAVPSRTTQITNFFNTTSGASLPPPVVAPVGKRHNKRRKTSDANHGIDISTFFAKRPRAAKD